MSDLHFEAQFRFAHQPFKTDCAWKEYRSARRYLFHIMQNTPTVVEGRILHNPTSKVLYTLTAEILDQDISLQSL
jgi:hypothetical protein